MKLYTVKNLNDKKEFETNKISDLEEFFKIEMAIKPDFFRLHTTEVNPDDPAAALGMLEEFITYIKALEIYSLCCFGPFFIEIQATEDAPELEPAPGTDLDPQVIINLAIDTFGETAQIVQAIQELSELTQALTKYLLKADPDVDHIEEEIADVNIMVRQLEIIFNNENVRKWEQYKIKRLKNTIEKYNAAHILEHLRSGRNENKL